ncbi:cytochrome P450 [Pseudonocardia acaciae]|uniref:cytochrome P450 n=1 Tax=Pseudonocardia acaciae TaxID=551276 RepID=UPI000491A64C|nr:cytochrome P450 [Pseudonocardia acaciae]
MSTARSATVWAIRYGLPGLVIRAAARRGDLISRLVADPALRAHPYAGYDQLRALGELVSNRLVSATATHRVANRILRDELFLADPGSGGNGLLDRVLTAAIDPKALGPVDPPSLLTLHPPDHTRIRGLVSRAFTPRAIAGLTRRIREVADDLLDRIEAGPGTFDLVETYAAPLPVTVIAEILGVPTAMRADFLRWGNEAAATLDPDLRWREFRRADRALRAVNGWSVEHLASLRREPGDNLLSRLVHLDDNGDRLTDVELRSTGLLLLGAGFETTVNLIGNGVALLLEHPDQLAALRADPSGWANAVEEVLRYDSPVQLTLRVAGEATEVAGRSVPAGRGVVVLLGGANRDPEVFTDPHVFDITRANARDHLAFSAGIHYCLGAQLARLEATIALRALFERFDLRLTGTPHRLRTRVLRGYRRLPLSRTPGA